MEPISSSSHSRKAYNIGIAICTITLLAFAIFLTIEPTFAAGKFGLEAAVKDTGIPSGDDVTITSFIARGIRAVTGLVGVIFLVLMLYAGLMWMTARGNVEQATKAKDTIMRAVIGLVIIASAYAITSFVINRVATSTDSSSTDSSSLIEYAPEFAFIPVAHAQGLGSETLKEVGEAGGISGGKSVTEAGAQLPVIIGNLVKGFISVLGIIFLFLIIYGGWLWLTARGDSERVENAKSTITRAIIGLVIIVSAYAITGFVITRLVTATS